MNTRSRAMQQQQPRMTFPANNRAARAPGPPVAPLQRTSKVADLGPQDRRNAPPPPAVPKKKLGHRKGQLQRRRSRSGGLQLEKDIEIQMAARKYKKKGAVDKKLTVSGVVWDFVYVGNINPAATYDQLKQLFEPCGTVTRIQLRCSRGQAVTIGRAVKPELRNSRNRQYATIEFARSSSARKALKLDGTTLNGCKLVVTVSPADLPEVQEILDARQAELAKRKKTGNDANTAKNPARSKRSLHQPTELDIAGSDRLTPSPMPKKDRHVMLGFSFPKTVL
ncbi:RRM domain-containing protein [Pleurotus pulmonarius]